MSKTWPKQLDGGRPVERGVTLVELIFVCLVLVILAMLAIPNIMQISASYKLDAAGHAVASLLQQAKTQAVQTNMPVYVNISTGIGTTNMAFITNDPTNTTFTAGSPDIGLPGAVSFQPPPAINGFHSQLDTYLNGGTPQFGTIGFNARGLPCTGTINVCATAAGGFEWFMQSNIGWEAVTVTAAGRIKTWRLSSQSNGTYSWQ